MFKFICLFALISAAFAASIGNVESTTEKRVIIPLLKFESENNPDGSFKFSYEGGDQSFREETAHVVDAGTEDEALEVSGSYRYIDEDGQTVEVHYTAGRNGFVPVGTNILPEISEAAKKAADLPQVREEELKRRGRSSLDQEVKVAVHTAAEPKQEESQVKEHKVEAPKVEEPKVEVHKVEAPKVEESKVAEHKVEATKVEEHKVEAPKVLESKVEEHKVEAPKVVESKVEEHKDEAPKVVEPKVEEKKAEATQVKEAKVEKVETVPVIVVHEEVKAKTA